MSIALLQMSEVDKEVTRITALCDSKTDSNKMEALATKLDALVRRLLCQCHVCCAEYDTPFGVESPGSCVCGLRCFFGFNFSFCTPECVSSVPLLMRSLLPRSKG